MAWMSFARKALPLCVLLTASFTAEASVWKTENRWSEAWENKFAEFIANVDTNIFNSTGKRWSGIRTDCAGAAYKLRIIFAFENKLPVSFNTWDGVMSNKSTAFDRTSDPVERVRKFMSAVDSETSTVTMLRDTYPIAIRRGVIKPGVMFLHPQDDSLPITYRAGHVLYVRKVENNGNIKYMASTVPSAVRTLDVRNGIQFAPMSEDGGFRAWNWPDSDERPYKSYEQFELGGWIPHYYKDGRIAQSWQKAIAERIATERLSASDDFQNKYENLAGVIAARVTAVNKGWKFYRQNYSSGSCMSEKDYDNFSTPTRDVKIQREIENFVAAARKYAERSGNSYKQLMASARFEVMPGVVIDANQLYQLFFSELVLAVSEPEHSPEVRWGLQLQGRWPCPHRAKQYVGGHLVQQ